MHPSSVLMELSPYARVTTAVAPFVAALFLRLVFGKNRVTRTLLSVSTAWFAVNVLLAPYSSAMRDDLSSLRGMFH